MLYLWSIRLAKTSILTACHTELCERVAFCDFDVQIKEVIAIIANNTVNVYV